MKIYNVKIKTMDSDRRVIENGWVEITDGIISAVESGSPEAVTAEDIDGNGRTVYPGFIDIHTHLGLSTSGVGMEGEDFNEESEPCTAHIRIVDGINPIDYSFELARKAGVTCCLVSPGSANPVAGSIAAVKTYGKRIDKMLVGTVGMKFSMGENPKLTYSDKEDAPYTRMAVAGIIREALIKAQKYGEVAGDGVSGGEALYKGVLLALSGSTSLQASTPALTELIATRGMGGMMDTVWLILCAMCLGGAMTACGMLGSITRMFVRFTHKLASTVAATVASGLFLNLATADQYISIILTGNMFKDIYKKNGYESRLLSRTTEDAVTVTSPLIPWNTCGMTQATILNVPTLVYLPYSFFNLLSPLMSIFVACIGFKIVRSVK